jgi:hypothetical protein
MGVERDGVPGVSTGRFRRRTGGAHAPDVATASGGSGALTRQFAHERTAADEMLDGRPDALAQRAVGRDHPEWLGHEAGLPGYTVVGGLVRFPHDDDVVTLLPGPALAEGLELATADVRPRRATDVLGVDQHDRHEEF